MSDSIKKKLDAKTPTQLDETTNSAIQDGLESADKGPMYSQEEVTAYVRRARKKWLDQARKGKSA